MGIEDGGLGRLFSLLPSPSSLLSPLPFLLFYRKAVPCDLLTDCERGTRIGDGGRGDSLPSSIFFPGNRLWGLEAVLHEKTKRNQ